LLCHYYAWVKMRNRSLILDDGIRSYEWTVSDFWLYLISFPWSITVLTPCIAYIPYSLCSIEPIRHLFPIAIRSKFISEVDSREIIVLLFYISRKLFPFMGSTICKFIRTSCSCKRYMITITTRSKNADKMNDLFSKCNNHKIMGK
jgi:uncharacterized membrane protein YesL